MQHCLAIVSLTALSLPVAAFPTPPRASLSFHQCAISDKYELLAPWEVQVSDMKGKVAPEHAAPVSSRTPWQPQKMQAPHSCSTSCELGACTGSQKQEHPAEPWTFNY